MKDNSKVFLLILLGMLTAFGPFVTDMYLPSLPSMGEYFNATSSQVQLGLTTSMIGLAVGQVLFGPLSDRYGRRRPLLAAMWLFLASTLLCLFSQTIFQFVAFRLLQGIAGAKGMLSDFSGWAFFSEGNVQKWQMEEAFDPENPTRYPGYPRLENLGNSAGHNTQVSDFWVRSANYLRIKNIQFGYTLPRSLFKDSFISNLRVYVASENPYTFHSMPSGWDPEIVLDANNQYAGGSFYPVLRNFTFGVNLKF